jgi:hypothetical protein
MPKKEEKICEDCGSDDAVKKHNIEKIYLCENCIKHEKYTYITKTLAKNDYFLKDGDLENLEMHVTKSGHGSRYVAYLHKLLDIKNIFCQKYNISNHLIDNKINELKNAKEEKSNRIKLNKSTKTTNRKKILEDELEKYKLKLRTDSKLCSGFIDGSIKTDISEVVQRMCQMKYLFDYCDMDTCFEKAKKEQQEEYDAGYFPDCSLFDQAELIALKKMGGYPKIWPWV